MLIIRQNILLLELKNDTKNYNGIAITAMDKNLTIIFKHICIYKQIIRNIR